jgi:hypothetical protein
MSRRYRFDLASDDPQRVLPDKIMVGMKPSETENHILLKAFGFVLFYRDRMEIEQRVHRDDILYVPDLVQFNFMLDVAFWGECGDCAVDKLDRLAVKVPSAEIWIIKKSWLEAEELLRAMKKAGLRKNRYHITAFRGEDFEELKSLLQMKNSIYLCSVDWDMKTVQMDFNGLWFDLPVLHETF